VKASLAILISLVVGALAGGFVTYQPTRDKWHELGREAGAVQGKAELLRDLCTFAAKGAAPDGAFDWHLDVKASRISLVQDGDAVRLFCQE